MRRSINSPYVYAHKNPIPHASVLNGLMISSAISGFDLKTNKFPEKKEEQVEIASVSYTHLTLPTTPYV